MNSTAERYCALCLEPRVKGERWFLLTENRWTDRLKLLAWDDKLAAQPGVYAACGTAHVQELVIHWMSMGTLDYPFARAYSENKKPHRTDTSGTKPRETEPDTKGVKVFGELAVHRESLERVLSESPQSLGTVLLAVVGALGGEGLAPTEREEEPAYALT
jgi:hypothetical protein